MKSMTGFGACDVETKTSRLHVHIRAVNGRFLEARLHVPREFMSFESDMRALISKSIERGTVDLFVTRKIKPGPQSLKVNADLAKELAKALKSLSKELKTPIELNSQSLFQMNGIFSVEEDLSVNDTEKKALLTALKVALEHCTTEKEREGLSLKKELTAYLKGLDALRKKMAAFKEKANALLLERFRQRLSQLTSKEMVEPSRIAQEVTIQIDRTDIGEELSRLTEHIKACLELLKVKTGLGKKLDFYCQELLREVNTIGSKSQLVELTQLVVEAKTLVEKLREQVQNLE